MIQTGKRLISPALPETHNESEAGLIDRMSSMFGVFGPDPLGIPVLLARTIAAHFEVGGSRLAPFEKNECVAR